MYFIGMGLLMPCEVLNFLYHDITHLISSCLIVFSISERAWHSSEYDVNLSAIADQIMSVKSTSALPLTAKNHKKGWNQRMHTWLKYYMLYWQYEKINFRTWTTKPRLRINTILGDVVQYFLTRPKKTNAVKYNNEHSLRSVSYTHLRAHET